jgi:SMC interacting uncharacterized protein involved in chromosome segregation
VSQRDAKVVKLTRALTSKDVLVADLKRRVDEVEEADKNAAENGQHAADKLRAALAASARKDAFIKDLRARLEAAEKDASAQAAQLVELQGAQSKLKALSKELAAAHRHVEQLGDERALLEKQKIELSNQLDLWKTKTHLQTAGQRNDLASLEREAARVGKAYDTLRGMVREVALQQVHAIEKLSDTLADLDRDAAAAAEEAAAAAQAASSRSRQQRGSAGNSIDLSLQDVHTLGIAAEFSRDDLESVTLQSNAAQRGNCGVEGTNC